MWNRLPILIAIFCLLSLLPAFGGELTAPMLAKAIVGNWALNVEATRAANPIKKGDPEAKDRAEYLQRVLTAPLGMSFLPSGIFEATGEGKKDKSAYRIVQSSNGEMLLISDKPHSSDMTVWHVALAHDKLTLTPLEVSDDFAWIPGAATLVLNRQ